MTGIHGQVANGEAAYRWGKRLLLMHLILLGLVLINGLANYFQASSLDKYLTKLNVNATGDEIHYLSDIILIIASVQALYLVTMHLMAWQYTRHLLLSHPVLSSTPSQQLYVLLQPVYGILRWWRSVEAKKAYEEDRRPKPAYFLSNLWWVIMSAVILFYGAYFWYVSVRTDTMEETALANLSYAHFALAAANFWFLWAAITGWRAISKVQQRLDQEFTDS